MNKYVYACSIVLIDLYRTLNLLSLPTVSFFNNTQMLSMYDSSDVLLTKAAENAGLVIMELQKKNSLEQVLVHRAKMEVIILTMSIISI